MLSTRPLHEKARIANVHALRILDTPREDRYDRIARLTARLLGTPAAALSFVDEDREWFKASVGWAIHEIPRNETLADEVIGQTDVFYVSDLQKQADYKDHPFTQNVGARFYAAHPIRGPNGGHVGVLAVIDERPRRLSEQDKQDLRDMARMAEHELGAVAGGENEAVLEAENPLRAAVQALSDPAAILDPSGTLRAVNDAWRDAMAPGTVISPVDEVGRNHVANLEEVEGFSREAARRLLDAINTILSSHDDRVMVRDIGNPKEHQDVDAHIQAIPGRGGRWLMLQHMDRSEERRRKEAEEEALERGLEAEALRGAFRFQQRLLDRYENEFNAPLTPIRLQLHLLEEGRRGDLNDDQISSVATIRRNVERWVQTLGDMMAELRRPEARQRERRECDLRELVSDVAHAFTTHAMQEGIRIEGPPEGDPYMVDCAVGEIRQAISEFVERSLADTGAGGTVSLQVAAEGDDVVVRIHDPGLTMEPAEGSRVLGPKGDLAMQWSKRVIDRHGGKAWVEVLGRQDGTVLAFRLPLVHRSGTTAGIASRPGPQERPARPDPGGVTAETHTAASGGNDAMALG